MLWLLMKDFTLLCFLNNFSLFYFLRFLFFYFLMGRIFNNCLIYLLFILLLLFCRNTLFFRLISL